jgi:hypothetical protein
MASSGRSTAVHAGAIPYTTIMPIRIVVATKKSGIHERRAARGIASRGK